MIYIYNKIIRQRQELYEETKKHTTPKYKKGN